MTAKPITARSIRVPTFHAASTPTVIAMVTATISVVMVSAIVGSARCNTSLVTGAQGVMSIPKSKMGKMTEDGKWTLESYAFDDVEVSTPAPDVAIIAYTVRQKVKMDGKLQEMHAADSSTWIRGTDGWECHAHSETILNDRKVA